MQPRFRDCLIKVLSKHCRMGLFRGKFIRYDIDVLCARRQPIVAVQIAKSTYIHGCFIESSAAQHTYVSQLAHIGDPMRPRQPHAQLNLLRRPKGIVGIAEIIGRNPL